MPKALTAVLVVHENGQPTRALTVGAGYALLGRAESCDLVLPDPDVSERHAEVKRVADRHIIDDLESDTGLYVGGRRVEFHVFERGDRVQIGPFHLEYFEDASDAATAAGRPSGWMMDAATYRDLVERQGSIRFEVGIKQTATIVSEDDPAQSWKPDEGMVFGAQGVPVEGLGANAEVLWDGRAHVIKRLGWRASLTVNGSVVDMHALVPGDRFQVGKSRFRYG